MNSDIPDDNMTMRPRAEIGHNSIREAEESVGLARKQELHPAVQAILKYFEYDHLPPHLASTSQPFCELAHLLATTLPSNAETTVALRKLLESKDCAVRARL